MCLIAPIRLFGQDDGQLAIFDRCSCLGNVERTIQPDGTGEAAEFALDQMKALFRGRRRRRLFSGDQQHAGAKKDAKRVSRDARDVDDNFNGFVGLEHVERGVTFPGIGALLLRKGRGQVLKQLPHIISELACFARRNKRELGHGINGSWVAGSLGSAG